MSTDRDERRAGQQAASEAAAAVGGAPDLALVFATVGYPQQALLASIREAVGPACAVVGCSGEGVIGGGQSNEGDHSVSVLAVRLASARAEGHLIEGYASGPAAAADELARRVGDPRDVLAVLVFPDGLQGNCTDFLAQLQARLPGVTVVGGAAGDAMTFQRTYQYAQGEVRSGAVAAAVLRGRGRVVVEVSHGCTPVSPHLTMTAVDGGWLREIDRRPAWDVFREFLDGDPKDLNAEGIVHLCLGTPAEPSAQYVKEAMVIRTPLALNQETGALFFPGGGLSQGQHFRMTRRDAGEIRKSAVTCARRVLVEGSSPAFVLQFDCAGRGKVLFGACAADEIIAPLRAEIGAAVPWAGFHTYGEIARTCDTLRYHNDTVALCAFYDS